MMVPCVPAYVNLAALIARRHRCLSNRCDWNWRTRVTSSNVRGDDNERFNEMEHRNWAQGYEAYDQGFGPLTRQTIPNLLEDAGFPPPGDKVGTIRLLDVATGPGFVLSSAIDSASVTTCQNSCHFTGLDITQNFLTLAKERTGAQLQRRRQKKQIKVDFIKGSAEAIPFPDNTFDSIVCNFGILHFFNPRAFLSESYRALRRGGKVSFSAWAPPAQTEGFRIALESIAIAGNPNVKGFTEGPNFFEYGDPDQSMAALREAAFEDVKSIELSEMKWDNVQNGAGLYRVLLNGTSRTREVLLGQTAFEAAAIEASMEDKYNSITDGGKRPLVMPALVTSGRKPF